MKYLLFSILLIAFIACKDNSSTVDEPLIQKGDLVKMKWIEGNWEGIYQGQPFYENYRMINDSTILITSFANVGTDFAATSHGYFTWNGSGYFLGKELNYKVVRLDEKEVRMIPNVNAQNAVIWTYVNDSTWTAVLPAVSDTANYVMKKVSPRMDSILLILEPIPDSLGN